MKKINKILAVIMSIAVMITTVSAVSIDAYAASKPPVTSITTVSAKSNSITVKWKKKSCTGYQIQYSTSNKFKSAKTVKVTKAKTTSKTISKLKSGKKYYVRVRTYKKSGKKTLYSKWSKAKSVTTKKASSGNVSNGMTLKVTPNKPKSSASKEYVYNKISLSWNKVKGADFYEITCESQSDDKAVEIKNAEWNTTETSKTEKTIVLDNCSGADYAYVKVSARDKYYDKGLKMTLYKEIAYVKQKVNLTKCEDSAKAMLDEAYAQMNITSNMSDFDKIIQIQKWIDANWHYTRTGDIHNGTCYCVYEDNNQDTYIGARAHSLVLEGHGGCQNFAYAFRYFANKAGVACEVICGDDNSDGKIDHYWNFIKVNGYWYDYDCESYVNDDGSFKSGGGFPWNYSTPTTRNTASYTLSNGSQLIYNNSDPKADKQMVLNAAKKSTLAKGLTWEFPYLA